MKRNFLTGALVMAAAVSGLTAQVKPKSNAEADAVRALFGAQGQSPDTTIKAAEDLLTKFADTEYKEVALLLEADAYQRKGDYASAEITDERVLEPIQEPAGGDAVGRTDPCSTWAKTTWTRRSSLPRADKRFDQALANIDTKPFAGMPDDKWEENKKFMRAQLQNDLGLMAMRHKKLDESIADFKLAADGDPQPAYQVRLAVAYEQAGKNDEALALCDKLLADPQLHPTIRQLAPA